jgi:hypothetical protein
MKMLQCAIRHSSGIQPGALGAGRKSRLRGFL